MSYGMYFQSLRLFATQKSTSLCKGGFFAANSAQTPSPPSDEGGVTAGDGGRENSTRVVEDADPYKLTARLRQPVGRGFTPAADSAQPHGRTQFAPTALPKPANSAQNPCLPREGGVGVADGGSVKGQTPPVSHPLDSPLGEGAKKDCAYAPQNLHNLSASRRAGQIVVNFL